MKSTRRAFLQTSVSGLAAALAKPSFPLHDTASRGSSRRFHFVQIDVFTAHHLQGNPLAVFPDARGLSDAEMQQTARETNLQETTFVIPRDPAIEREHGIKVRIFVPGEEIPFGGHPTLGTAMVLRNRMLEKKKKTASVTSAAQTVSLDLKVGKIPVVFRTDSLGAVFGEMHQVDPAFSATHDRAAVAAAIGLNTTDISDEWPIQTISTGLPFAIVPLKQRSTLQSLRPDLRKIEGYFAERKESADFYYITRDTEDPSVTLRSRAIFAEGEDPATGSAAGCTAAWMVRYGLAEPGQTVHIQQGVEIKRPSNLFARAEKLGEKILNVRVGGNAVEIAEGEYSF